MPVVGESTSSSLVPAKYNQSDLISKCTPLLTSAHGLNKMKVENGDFKMKGGHGSRLVSELRDYKLCGVTDF